jgi:hypothetical protein
LCHSAVAYSHTCSVLDLFPLVTPLLAELIRSGAKVRHVRKPGGDPEPVHRPSTALDEFVRLRDLTCRFPNCDAPAESCDLDHTRPWPRGPTHPSKLKCLCRKHHLLKAFWTGWSDQQLPDGTTVGEGLPPLNGHHYDERAASDSLLDD